MKKPHWKKVPVDAMVLL